MTSAAPATAPTGKPPHDLAERGHVGRDAEGALGAVIAHAERDHLVEDQHDAVGERHLADGLEEVAPRGTRPTRFGTGTSMVVECAVVYNPGGSSNVLASQELEQSAPTLGLTLQRVEVRKPAEFESASAAMTRGKAQALFMMAFCVAHFLGGYPSTCLTRYSIT
jgi:hypothetical protein